jgi:tRNA nucleotidyltransferase (CCA-adding enzyme)
MTELIKTIVSLGGTCFYTGVPLRDKLLGRAVLDSDILLYGMTAEELQIVLDKNGYTCVPNTQIVTTSEGGRHSFRVISGIHDLNTPTDFSMHSIYMNCDNHQIYDPFDGVRDLRSKTVRVERAVLQAAPVKLLEACRLTAELGFSLHLGTWYELYDQARLAKFIDVKDLAPELIRILMLDKPSIALKLMQETRLLEFVLPELAACENIMQSKRSGVHNVFEHTMFAIDASDQDLMIRLTVLFHDIAKPQTLEIADDGKIHFFKHEVIGAKIAKQYMRYWGLDKDLIQKVSHLVLHHMFDADPRLTDKSVRRLIRKVGKDLIYDLLKVRIADRLGTPNKISMKKIKLLKKKIDREIMDI